MKTLWQGAGWHIRARPRVVLAAPLTSNVRPGATGICRMIDRLPGDEFQLNPPSMNTP
jgi:hypothetical protein